MIFSHTNEALAVAVYLEIRVALVLVNGQPLRTAALEPVNVVIGKVREQDHSAGDCERASAVLVYARTSVKRRGEHVYRGTVGRYPDDDVPALLRGPFFNPIWNVTIQYDLTELNRPGGNDIGAEGRLPGSIGSDALIRHS
jgi:hypothetical protein